MQNHLFDHLRIASSVLSLVVAVHAAPVTGPWLVAQGGGPVTNESTASPTVGDGTANSADTDAIQSSITGISLVNVGDRITLTGSATLTGLLPNGIRQFRWGLYDVNGSPDVNGWLGYFATQGSGATRGELYERKSPNTTQYFAGGTGNASVNFTQGSAPGNGIGFVDGTYSFSLSVERMPNGVQVYSAIRRASDNQDFGTVSLLDTSPLTYDFNRVGFLIGGALDADQVQFTDIDVTFSSISRLRVILLAGQSNADGRADPAELPTAPIDLQQPQNDVDLFYSTEGGTPTLTTLTPGLSETSGFGPEISLGRNMADLWSVEDRTRIAIIKYANGGTNLQNHWKAGGDATTTGDGPEYIVFQQTVADGLSALATAYPDAVLDFQGMVWMQGESDAVNGFESSYQTNLTSFITDVRATYGADLPFIIGRLSSAQTDLPAGALATVRTAQTNVAATIPRVGLVDTDTFGVLPDNLHFDGAGQQSLGQASAFALISYVPFLSPPALARLGNGDIEITVENVFPGMLYTLENSGTLLPGDWTDGDAQVAAGATIILAYSPPPGETARFFRVKRSPAP
jgi:hypothetical protein